MAKPHKQPQPPMIPPKGGTQNLRSSRAFTIWTEEGYEPPPPVMPTMGTIWTQNEALAPNLLTLIVLQSLASGRHVKCVIKGMVTPPGENRLEVVCQVGSAANFRMGMEIAGAAQRSASEPRLWVYNGKLPRRAWHW